MHEQQPVVETMVWNEIELHMLPNCRAEVMDEPEARILKMLNRSNRRAMLLAIYAKICSTN